MDVTSFPILFNITKTGKTMKWRTWAEGEYSVHQFGEVGGKMRDPVKRLAIETNIGKSNHKTAIEQAILICKRAWTKQLDKGYTPKDKEGQKLYTQAMKEKGAQRGNNHGVLENKKVVEMENNILRVVDNVETTILPMLAHKFLEKKDGYSDRKKTVKYIDFEQGVYVQPKLDGVRCIARVQRNAFSSTGFDIVMTSRTGKQFVFLAHLKDALLKLLSRPQLSNTILDGELYISANEEDKFNLVSACCRTTRNEPHKKEKLVEYHVFDSVDMSTPPEYNQEVRLKQLKDLSSFLEPKFCIKLVSTYEIHAEEDVYKYQQRFIDIGYEGVIIRSKSGLYMQKHRSPHLLKYKQFEDTEFVIIGATKGEGDEAGCVIWICQANDGQTFSCRPRGTFEYRKRLYNNYTKYLGSMLTVRFQELTPTGIPRFPVGIAVRNYE